jgi:hypothetical protein
VISGSAVANVASVGTIVRDEARKLSAAHRGSGEGEARPADKSLRP